MPNLLGASPISCDGGGRSHVTRMVGRSGTGYGNVEEIGQQDAKNGA